MQHQLARELTQNKVFEFGTGINSDERLSVKTSIQLPQWERGQYMTEDEFIAQNIPAYVPQHQSLQFYTSDTVTLEGMSCIPFDIDAPTFLEALEDTRRFINWLDMNTVHDYQLYFSGSKGFHIILPWQSLNRANSPEANYVLKWMVSSYLRSLSGVHTFDPLVYSNKSFLRMPNTRNVKSGLYKIPLTREEILKEDMTFITDLAAEPRFGFEPEFRPSNYLMLSTLYDMSKDLYLADKVRRSTLTGDIYLDRPIEEVEEFIARAVIPRGRRHQVSLMLANYFKARGLTQQDAENRVVHFMTHATGTRTPVRVRIIEGLNDVKTCYANNIGFSIVKAREIMYAP